MSTAANTLKGTGGSAEALTLPVQGMTCSSCVGHVELALKRVEGVTAVRVDPASERASVNPIPDRSDAGYVRCWQRLPWRPVRPVWSPSANLPRKVDIRPAYVQKATGALEPEGVGGPAEAVA